MLLVTSPAYFSPEGVHGEAEAYIGPCDSQDPKKNHMSPHPDSLPPDCSHPNPLPSPPPEQTGLCLSAALSQSEGLALPAPTPAASTHSDVLPCPVALLSPFHRGRPGQLWEMGARGGEQVRDCRRSLCSGCPPRGPIPVGLSAPCPTEAAGPWHLLGSLADVVQAEGGQVVLGTHKQASTLLIHQQRFVAAGPR